MRIEPSGITPTDLAEYKSLVAERLQAIFRRDFVLDDETVVGQLVGTLALALAQVDERAVDVVNAFNVNTAVGEQLDSLGSVIALTRHEARSSTVVLTVSSTASTTIPAGSRVSAAPDGSPAFTTDAEVSISGAGSATVNATAVDSGPIEAEADTLVRILNPVVGWSAVNNPAAALPGRSRETDSAYRRRFQTAYAHLGRDGLENIRSAVLNVEGVRDVRVEENNTASSIDRSGVAIAGHSIYVVVDYEGTTAPAADSAREERVGRAILESKPAGVGTVNRGATDGSSADVVLSHGGGGRGTTTINFDWVVRIPLEISLRVELTRGVAPSNWENLIKQRIVQWFSGGFTPQLDSQQLFDSSGIQIGEHLDTGRLQSPIYSVPGLRLTADPSVLRIGMPATALGTPNLNERYTLSIDHITATGSWM